MWRIKRFARTVLALRAARGPYRFLVKRWDAINDLELAARVLGTDYFKHELEPLPLPIKNISSILVLAPHQDDESIGAGGALLLARNAGCRLTVLYLTDGAPEPQNATFAGNVEEAVAVRDKEALQACSHLRADIAYLGLSNVKVFPTIVHARKLAQILHDLRPQVVLAPWLLDSPAKHRMTNHLLWAANRMMPLPDFEVWGYQVHNTVYPNGYIDITSVIEEKRQLIQYFQSQNNFSAPYDHLAIGLAAWNSRILRGPEKKYLELFFTVPKDELFKLVERFYFKDLRATYRGHAQVLPGMAEFHRSVMAL